MTLRRAQLGIIACAVGVGANVHGQVGGEATWLWEVTTPDGDTIVEPTETATVSLFIDFAPDADADGPVLGLATAVWDTLGAANANLGEIVGWELNDLLDDLPGDTTTTDGVNLFGTTAAQLPFMPLFVHDDPVHVLTFEWSPSVHAEYTVEYHTFAYIESIGEHVIIVWEGDELRTSEDFIWPIEEAMISFQVVPGPGGLCLGAVVGLAAVRRRRG